MGVSTSNAASGGERVVMRSAVAALLHSCVLMPGDRRWFELKVWVFPRSKNSHTTESDASDNSTLGDNIRDNILVTFCNPTTNATIDSPG